MHHAGEAISTAETIFRVEFKRILVTLTRVSGSVDQAEDALQDAFASALISWPKSGIPTNPAAWVTAAAHRRLIDALRRERTRRTKSASILNRGETHRVGASHAGGAFSDADRRLGLIFLCCHPDLNHDARVVIALRTLGGLTTCEVARVLSVPEATVAQRLVRAKRKIRESGISFEQTLNHGASDCLRSIQEVIYLLFNEGFTATARGRLERPDRCAGAIELGRALCRLLPDDGSSLGLLTRMLSRQLQSAAERGPPVNNLNSMQ